MGHRYPPVKECIYCGRTAPPLDLEHIIPLTFGGNLLLPKASCRDCAKIINEQIETPVISHEWGAFRAKRKFPTRKKKGRRTHVTIRDSSSATRTIPIEEHSTPVPLYRFKQARILSGAPRRNDNYHFTMSILTSHEEEMEMKRKFPNWDQTHRILAQPLPFARLLAKIAHGYITAELGIRTFTPLNLDLILGRTDDYTLTVGGNWDIPPPVPGGDHITKIHMLFASPVLARVIVDIRLFSATETPLYHVVAGEIDFHRPEHVRAFEKHRTDGKIENVPLNDC
ncbi:MAG: hypothetical protein HY368_02095 [Candidatus Aenigmarchaeota archaeon]|nr:hypothetical protein [Candidatus Aenigmarchaeota archaeon]